MIERSAADFVLILHLAYIVFVVLGGLVVLRIPQAAWLHLPAAAWGIYVEMANRICPLTVLENSLRRRAGQAGFEDSFVEHYLVPLIYPSGLTRTVQVALASLVIVINVVLYGMILRRWWKTRINVP
jgi:hypothetical protein